MADEVREVPGAVRVRYVGLKNYGWFWKRKAMPTWVVEVFESWSTMDCDDIYPHNHKGWCNKWTGTSLEQAEQERDRWAQHPEVGYEPV